jgi:hypothetical protein
MTTPRFTLFAFHDADGEKITQTFLFERGRLPPPFVYSKYSVLLLDSSFNRAASKTLTVYDERARCLRLRVNQLRVLCDRSILEHRAKTGEG